MPFKLTVLVLLASVVMLASPAMAGPGTAAGCWGLCTTSCTAMGVFAFYAALGRAAGANGIVGPGPGVFIGCNELCGPVCAYALCFPTP
jgi:hypothetical protein